MADLTEICAECKNYFLPDYVDLTNSIYPGTYTIANGVVLNAPFLLQGQYFRIVGSVLNDGVYQNTAQALSGLQDETFTGSIWNMHVPPAFITLANDIATWRDKNESVNSKNMSPFTSESISGVYSYSKSGSGGSGGGSAVTWQDQFRARLRRFRRIYEL